VVAQVVVPEAQAMVQLQEAVQRASSEKTHWESQCDADSSKVESLRRQLEDAHAAVVGYQLDCTNFAGRTSSLETEVAELQEECAMRRTTIQASSKTGDMLQDQLEDLRTRCEVLKKCKAEFSTSLATGAVADEAMVRYLNFHLQEASTRLSQTAARVASLRSRCKALAGMSDEIVSELKEYQREASVSAAPDVDMEKLKDLLVAPPMVFSDIPVSEHEAGSSVIILTASPQWTFRASSPTSSDADQSEVSRINSEVTRAHSELTRVPSDLTRIPSVVAVGPQAVNPATAVVLTSNPGSGFASAEDCTAVSDAGHESLPTVLAPSGSLTTLATLVPSRVPSPVPSPGPSPESSISGSAAGSVTVSVGHTEGISSAGGYPVGSNPAGSASIPAGSASVPVGSGRSNGGESPYGPHHFGHRMPVPAATVVMGPTSSPCLTSAGSSSAGSDFEPSRSPTRHHARSWALVNGAQSARVGSLSPTSVLEPGLRQRGPTGMATPGLATYNSVGRSPRMQSRARSPGAAGAVAGSTTPGHSRGSAAHRSPAGSGSASATSRHFASSRSVSPQQHTPSPPQSPSMAHWRIRRRSKPSGVPAHVVLSPAPFTTQSSTPTAAVAVGSTQRPQSPMRGRCQLEARRQQLCDHICQLQALHTELRYLDNILSTASQAENSSGVAELSFKTASLGERIEASLAPLLCTLGAPEPLDATSSASVPALRMACNRLRVLVEPWASTGSPAVEAEAASLGAATFPRAVVPGNHSPGVPTAIR